MAAPTSVDELLDLVRKSKLIEPAKLDAYLTTHPEAQNSTHGDLAKKLAAVGLLTTFQTEQLLRGKHRGYFLGKYKLMERIGMGGMGQVFLAEHTSMRRRSALKVLPPDMAADQFARERFMREARAIGQLDHPNLVKAFDVDSDADVLFIVMEYIEGINLHDLVSRFGQLDPNRAGHYLWQAAQALAYIHANRLVHRDIKPANLLVDRSGVIKLLDLGLVRDTLGDNELTRGQGVKMLGTADYLAPEQAVDSSGVDTRADIYSLGATGYFLLTAKPPYPGEKVAQKLIAHQTKPIPLVSEVRSDVPPELTAILAKMMAKKPADRYQTPEELLEALDPWATPVDPPTENEIPAVVGGASGNPGSAVNLGMGLSRVGRVPGGSSLNGSAIRYHSPDSNLTTTPRPGGPGSQIRTVGPRLASGSGSGRLGNTPAPQAPASGRVPLTSPGPNPWPTPSKGPRSPAASTPKPPTPPAPPMPPAPPVPTPVPTVPLGKSNLGTPKPPAPVDAFDAPALPASVAYAAQPVPIPGAPQVANPFKTTKSTESLQLPTGPAPESSGEVKLDPKSAAKPTRASSPGCLRRWFSMIVACSMTIGIAAWDVMLMTGATAKSASPEPVALKQPVGEPAAKPAPEFVRSTP